mmetsp:Transcript_23185/g.54756  ORF Transcript_23185/g.54756 Transcript_23185/m.54756 type:complete len:491 (+) Transcript_23185:97-1569(+)
MQQEAAMRRLQSQVERFRRADDKRKRELDAICAKLEERATAAANGEVERGELTRELETTREELARCQKELRAMEATVGKAQRQVRNLKLSRAEDDAASRRLAEVEGEATEAALRATIAEAQLGEREEELRGVREELGVLQHTGEVQSARLELLRGHAEQLEESLRSKEEQIQTLQEETASTDEIETLRKRLRDALHSNKQLHKQLRDQASAPISPTRQDGKLADEVARYAKLLKEAEAGGKLSSDKAKKLEWRCQVLQGKADALMEELSATQHEVRSAQDDARESVKKERAMWGEKIKQMERKVATTEASLASTQREAEEGKTSLLELKEDLAAREDEIRSLNKRLVSAAQTPVGHSSSDSLETKVLSLQAELEALRKRLTAEREAKAAVIAKATDTSNQLEGKIRFLMNRLSHLGCPRSPSVGDDAEEGWLKAKASGKMDEYLQLDGALRDEWVADTVLAYEERINSLQQQGLADLQAATGLNTSSGGA